MNPFSLMGLAGGLGSAAGGLFNMFRPKKNPNDSANQYLNQIPGAMQGYYKPYQDAGRGALGTLQGEYGKMTNNPGELLKNLSSGYKESPGYQQSLQAALQAGQNSSASGGMLGTNQDQNLAMNTASGMASKDYEDYLNHIMGLYGQGIGGNQKLESQGYDADSSYANMLGSVLGQQGQNAYNSTMGENMSNSQDWSNIFGGLSGAATGYGQGKFMDDYFNKYMGG